MSVAITYDEVVREAIRILREGRNITKPLIRERLGNRGSHSTIQKHLDTWRESLAASDLEVLPPSMPPELTPHLEAFWNSATAIVESQLASEWDRAKEMVESAQQEKDEALATRDRWQEYAREKDADLLRVNNENQQLRDQLSDLKERLKVRDLEYQGLLDRLDAKDRAMEAEREAMAEKIALNDSRHEQAMASAASKWDAEKERLEEQARAATERAELEVRRSDQHEIYFLNEVQKARDETERTRERSEREVTRLEQELIINRRREESLSVKLGAMEERLHSSQEESEKLQKENQALSERIARVESDRDRLKDLYEQIKINIRKNEEASKGEGEKEKT